MRVILREQVLRDGLQREIRLLSLTEKLALVKALVQAGVGRIELGSFVNPRAVPQVANTDVLAALVRQQCPDLACSALVIDERGLERALRCGLAYLCVPVPVSDSESRARWARPATEVQEAVIRLITDAATSGAHVRAGVRSAFGSAEEETVTEAMVLETAARMAAAGVAELTLIDTAGLAQPQQVRHLVAQVRAAHPGLELSLHLRDTRGLGLVNLYAGWEAGVRIFDVAAGGLGGGPAESPAGNVATEDAVYLLEGLGAATGIDLARFCQVVEALTALLERPLPGRIHRVLGSRPTDVAGN